MRATVLYMQTTTDTARGIARAVAAALREAGVGNKDAAAQSGIPLSTLERRLSGRGKAFDVVELELLANLVGRDVSDFIVKAAA